MKLTIKAVLGAGLLALAACGGQGDDAAGDNAADAAEAKADGLEEAADNAATDNAEEALEEKAEETREAGEDKEEAIDEADGQNKQ